VHVYAVGEPGDNSFPVWSSGHRGGDQAPYYPLPEGPRCPGSSTSSRRRPAGAGWTCASLLTHLAQSDCRGERARGWSRLRLSRWTNCSLLWVRDPVSRRAGFVDERRWLFGADVVDKQLCRPMLLLLLLSEVQLQNSATDACSFEAGVRGWCARDDRWSAGVHESAVISEGAGSASSAAPRSPRSTSPAAHPIWHMLTRHQRFAPRGATEAPTPSGIPNRASRAARSSLPSGNRRIGRARASLPATGTLPGGRRAGGRCKGSAARSASCAWLGHLARLG
jgi:hypothetical protein